GPVGIYALAEHDEALLKAFLVPTWRGSPLTDVVLASIPDPYLVDCTKGKDIPPMWGGGDNPWYVDDQVRNLLEELDPGRHRFLPIRIRHQKSNIDERPFYILHVTSVVRDTIVVEETRFADGIGKTDYFGGGK
ncbi:MAG: hypothetical protein NW217_08350, partial [Hyphomicrobiaceae bacterium]|nr:hypothetical protein [Hyphomicrobiaceae bacterium]